MLDILMCVFLGVLAVVAIYIAYKVTVQTNASMLGNLEGLASNPNVVDAQIEGEIFHISVLIYEDAKAILQKHRPALVDKLDEIMAAKVSEGIQFPPST